MRRALRVAIALGIVIVLAAGGFGYWFNERVAVDRSLPRSSMVVIVPSGATGHEIAARLAHEGVLTSAFTFELLARLRGERSRMQAGQFRFAAHLTQRDVLRQLVEGGQQLAAWVTIPEGYTDAQIAGTLAAHRLGDEARLADEFARGSLVFDGRRTASLEGYLFPDTYLIPRDAKPAAIAKMLTGQFRAELPANARKRARALRLTIPQIVTLASLVEREGKVDAERPLIAGVIYNRLRRGMPLQVDASLEYIFKRHKDVITYGDLALDSPYNTYRHAGLPPTPIANPGLPSLRAAFFPAASEYLYYVAMGNGRHAFSRTLAEHNANVARYLH
ncbi:MAG: endolytic transglycosylase MltG [Candidatus Eremiobacteraeota bacterium]|nr:endolytic transglycosylase MltG [Candidatus Eremiobacteraeota bacterium]MBC5801708.1 endolytic transglycosylase MltG [Candidatus Eremiobacteraeota bacterium]MBC5821806.1 endolytic transglycosylase MltG [Candidatus Eremiobacteraeota bacterium]